MERTLKTFKLLAPAGCGDVWNYGKLSCHAGIKLGFDKMLSEVLGGVMAEGVKADMKSLAVACCVAVQTVRSMRWKNFSYLKGSLQGIAYDSNANCIILKKEKDNGHIS